MLIDFNYEKILRINFAKWIGLLLICSLGIVATASDNVYLTYSPDGVPIFSNTSDNKNSSLVIRDSASPRRLEKKPAFADRTQRREQFIPIIRQVAYVHSLDPALLAALIDVESGFEPTAMSPKGAMGLMQLIPMTASQYGLSEPYDPSKNIEAGTRFLRDLLFLHNGNIALALAAYNAGQGSVSRHKRRIPPYDETLLYVPRVMAKIAEYQSIFSESGQ